MSEIADFERYDEELRSLMKQLFLQAETLDDQQCLLQQCDELIQQMSLEARSIAAGDAASFKNDLLVMVKTRKAQLQSLKQQVERKSLMLGAESSVASAPRVLQHHEDMLANQNETLERARRSIEEAEGVGMQITKELGGNRERIASVHGKVKEMSGMTERASKLLDSMNRRWFWR